MRSSTDAPDAVPAPVARPAPLIPPVYLGRLMVAGLAVTWLYFFHGFLGPVLTAMVIALASWPLYRRMRQAMGGDTLAATAAIGLVLVFIVTPVVLATGYAAEEVREWSAWLAAANRDGAPVPAWIAGLPAFSSEAAAFWTEHVGTPGALGGLPHVLGVSGMEGLTKAAISAGGSLLGYALSVVFMLFTLFFLYRNGPAIAREVAFAGESVLPGRWGRFSAVVPAAVRSTVNGMTLIAIGEGIVLGVADWLAGVPSPVAFGALTGFMALVPGGAPLSFTLVSAWLALTGSPVAGLFLFLWGSAELFVVDKTIRPKLVGGPIKLPFLPTFFGLVGGVKTMGFLGLFIGPVVMALAFAAWKEWTVRPPAGERPSDFPAEG